MPRCYANLRELAQLPHNRSCVSVGGVVTCRERRGVVGFENAQTLQMKAFERIRWSQFGHTGLTAVFGTFVTQNRGLEHNFKNLRYF